MRPIGNVKDKALAKLKQEQEDHWQKLMNDYRVQAILKKLQQNDPKLNSQERFEKFKFMLYKKRKVKGKKGQKKDEMEAIMEVQ